MFQRKIELLSPARDIEVGMAAINHGADAVYIGGPAFGARKAAGNSLSDIERLVKHAALFNAKVYATLNTILYDNELEQAEKLARNLWNIGVNALIVQDMALAEMNLPIPLHASTQTNNMDWEKVLFFEKIGFEQVVLGRELSLEQIRVIKAKTTIPLEYFVHGALCVGQSGQCYMSHIIGNRSANRGECAQPCRLPWSLCDAKGKVLIQDKYLLSLKDLNNSNQIEQILDAGISSLKIEGRLKDIQYVKNVTLFYRKALDEIFKRRDDYEKSSDGTTYPCFEPNLEKSFSRGFSNYFLNGRKPNIDSPHTPKARGEKIGKVIKVGVNNFTISSDKTLHNGDGLCFFDSKMDLIGMRINTAVQNVILPNRIEDVFIGAEIYRNLDVEWQKILDRSNGNRKIGMNLILSETNDGFMLLSECENEISQQIEYKTDKIVANNPEKATENIYKKCLQWGDTIFEVKMFDIDFSQSYLIPASLLGEMKRLLLDKLLNSTLEKNSVRTDKYIEINDFPYPEKELTYLGNVVNNKSRAFYERHGVEILEEGLEKKLPEDEIVVMTTKHCIRFANGMCSKLPDSQQGSLYLKRAKDVFRLDFDCANCKMNVIYKKL